MSRMKQYLSRALSFLLGAVFVLLLLVIVVTVYMTANGRVPSFFGYSVMRVVSGSMEPTLPVDAFILVKQTEAQELAVGDIISFYSADPAISGSPNTHRIAGIRQTEDGISLITKGDANPVEDSYPVSEEALIGRFVGRVGFFEWVSRLLGNQLVFLLVVILPLIGMTAWQVRHIVLLRREASQEEEHEAAQSEKEPPSSDPPANE